MTEPARTKRILELYQRVARAAPEDRDDVLRVGSAGDAELASEVAEMMRLDAGGADDAFSEERIASVRRTFDGVFAEGTRDAPFVAGARVGSYELVRSIGEGGTSLVYEALQSHPRRRVALKIVHPGALDDSRRARFHREVQALGRLQHPGIAQIHEGGTVDVDGRSCPYLAMELVCGPDLVTWADREGLDRAARLELLASVADAVEHAHARGVLHRDLKPANVLVTESGQPKVLDFGIARVADPSGTGGARTRTGEILGTIAYMSPEQLVDPERVTGRSDVYALGVVAFEVLAGRPPIPLMGLSLAEAVDAARTADPVPLGALDPRLRGDVETVVAKALEKDPRRRYASPGALADDLRRSSRHLPVAARPPSAYYRARKLLRRHRAPAAAALGFALSLVLGIVLAVAWAGREQAGADRARRRHYAATLAGANYALDLHDPLGARAQFERAPVGLRGWEWHHVLGRLETWIVTHRLPARAVGQPAYLADGRLAIALEGGRVALYDPEEPEPDLLLGCGFDLESMAAEQPPGRVVAAARGGPLVAWDLATCEPAVAEQRGVAAVAPGTAAIALLSHALEREERVGPEDRAEILALLTEELDVLRDGRPLLSPDFEPARAPGGASARPEPPDPPGPWDRPGWVALAVGQRAAWVLDAATWEVRHELLGHSGRVTGMAVTPDGARVLTASADGTVRMWDTSSWRTVGAFEHGFGDAYVAVDPRGALFSVAARDGRGLRTWRLEPPGPRVLSGHDTFVYGAAVSPDGRTVASVGFWGGDARARLWDAATGAPVGVLPLASAEGWVAFARGGDALVTAVERYGMPVAFDLATGALDRVGVASWVALDLGRPADDGDGAPADVRAPAAAPGPDPVPGFRLRLSAGGAPHPDRGTHVAASGPAGTSQGRRLEPHERDGADVVPEVDQRAPHTGRPHWSGGAVPVAEASARAEWMVAAGRVAGDAGGLRARDVAVSRDGRLAAWVTGRGRGGPRDSPLFEASGAGLAVVRFPASPGSPGTPDDAARGGTELARVGLDVARECAPDFRPGGAEVAVGLADGRVAVWAWRRGTAPELLDGHTDVVYAVAYDPKGERLATGGNDNRVILWDAETRERTIELTGHERYVHALAWSPDGTQLVSASGDRTLRIWDSVSPAERHRRVRRGRDLAADVRARLAPRISSAGVAAALGDPRWTPDELAAARRAVWERRWGSGAAE